MVERTAIINWRQSRFQASEILGNMNCHSGQNACPAEELNNIVTF
jgi:hypothetical protein